MMMNVWFRFLLVGIAAAMAQAADDSKYLYRSDPKAGAVKEYTEHEGDFIASTQPRVVEFYSPFCGACRAFKSHYLALAKETQDAYPNVEFYGVSCTAHKEMCQQFKINSFPALITFAGGDIVGNTLSRAKSNLADVVQALKLDDDNGAQPGRQLEDSAENEVNSSDEDIEDIDDEDEEASSRDKFDVPDMEEDIADVPDVEEDIAEDSQDVVDSGDMDEEDIGGSQDDAGRNSMSLDDSEDKHGVDEGLWGDGVINNHGIADLSDASDSDSGDTPDAPAPQTFHGFKAGAIAARGSPLEMDKYKTLLKKRNQKLRNKLGGLSLRHKAEVESPSVPGDATTKMKAYTPGTTEYIERSKLIAKKIERIERIERRKRFRNRDDGSANSRASGARVPFKKAVTKPRFVEKLPGVKRVVRMSDEETLILDTTLSFIHGLQFGVFTSKSALPAKKRRALKNWLDLLSVSLPAEWALHDLIDDLLANINSISESDANLSAILKKYPTPRAVWSDSCSKGVKGGQFSCGVWKLLHTVTVGVAEYRGGLNLLKSQAIPPNAHMFSPLEAADTIRDYIENFFLCSECTKNFVEHYDRCKNNRRCERLTDDALGASSADWKELPAWLWEVHNGISVRLLNERADKTRKQMQRSSAGRAVAGPGAATLADEIKVLWPTLAECVTCFTDEGTWNQDGVFLFLEKTYWPGSDLDIQAVRLMSLDNMGPEGSRLTIILALFGIALVYFMRKNLRSTGMQQTILAARAMRPKGSVGVQKRSV